MRWHYRCSSCRSRNTWSKPLFDFVRGRKCKHCGHTRFYVDKERMTRVACYCNGYHHPHRPGSPYCEKNPNFDVNDAKRRGADEIDIAFNAIGAKLAKPGEPIPF